ncbi:MAG: carboxypeptidase-like regulatory domain-containing protein, partial [Bacteroidales bacterium]|nr:carboxypeptidase-like regulatory domain-containing protein [Bacteroidales bacterium]
MKKVSLLCLLVLTNIIVYSQALQQTLKGSVIDKATQIPLAFATIVVEGSGTTLGATSDLNGEFRFENVAVGRYTVAVSFVGYTSAVISELLISSGKESVLEIELAESVNGLAEVVVKAHTRKDKALNPMAGISARSFTVEETRRYAGGLDDPARMASAFAGVSTGNVQDNAIIIRGNSPKGILWRVEGVEVPNPNHFSGGNVLGGGFVSIISSQLLANSDFFTGAFLAEYGNALAGVFDIKLRTGNTEKYENTFQIGMHGIDFASEGPISKNNKASYLFNYRYSTFGLLAATGAISPAQIPIYQDLSFKLNYPTRNAGIFSLWGMGGVDKMFDRAETDPELWENNMDRYDNDWNEKFGAMGTNHKYIVGSKSYINSSVVVTGNAKLLKQQKINDLLVLQKDMDLNDNTGKLTFTSFFNHKFSAKHTNRTGFNFNTLYYNLDLSGASNDDPESY